MSLLDSLLGGARLFGRGRSNTGRSAFLFGGPGGFPFGQPGGGDDGSARGGFGFSPLDLTRVLWSTEKRKMPVSQGAFKNEFNVQVVTAMTVTDDVAVAILVTDEQGRDIVQMIVAAGGPLDPILLHRAHSLVSQVKEVEMGDSSVVVAAITVAAAANENMTTTLGIDPKKAEALLRKLIGDGAYDAAINAVPADIGDILGKFEEWGVTPYLETVAKAVEAGAIEYQAVSAYGVESPDARAARKAKREELLLPLRPHFEKYLEGPADRFADRLQALEEHVVKLAAYGFKDPDILVGWAIYRELQVMHGAESVAMAVENLFGSMVGIGRVKPVSYADRAANLAVQLLDTDARDQVAIRRELVGIEHDLLHGLLEVEQNEPAETLS